MTEETRKIFQNGQIDNLKERPQRLYSVILVFFKCSLLGLSTFLFDIQMYVNLDYVERACVCIKKCFCINIFVSGKMERCCKSDLNRDIYKFINVFPLRKSYQSAFLIIDFPLIPS